MENVLTIASYIGAFSVIASACYGVIKFYNKQHDEAIATKQRNEAQDKDINRLKEENCLIVFALSACLDGLEQLGANHTVPVAKNKLDKYINEMAHDQN